MKIQGVHTILVQVTDMNRSVAFFRDGLGLEVTYASPYWTTIALGEQRLGLHPVMGEGATPSPRMGCIVGLTVDNILALRTIIESLGGWMGELHETPSGVVMDFTDPDNNTFQAIQLGSKLSELV